MKTKAAGSRATLLARLDGALNKLPKAQGHRALVGFVTFIEKAVQWHREDTARGAQ
jgi:hypothetical protein